MATLRLLIIFLLFLSCTNYDKKDIRVLVGMKEVLKFEKSFEHRAGRGIRLGCDDTSIYVSNDPDFKIYLYSYSGKLVRRLGRKGPAPFENNAIWSFSLDEGKHNYWVHDFSKQLLKKFSLVEDTLVTVRKMITMNNVLYIGKDKFIIPRADDKSGGYLLSLFDVNTVSYTKNFDLIVLSDLKEQKSKEHLGFIFEGNFCRNKNYATYYCYSTGLFFVINLTDYTIKTIEDIRQLPIPKVYIKNGEIQLDPKLFASTSAAMDDKYLYSLTTKDVADIRGKGKFQIDVYEIENRRYQGSFEVDKLNGVDKPREIAVHSNKMVILFDSGLINIYKINTSGLPLL
jgi:hypothetical protein